jgi:aldose 1-epimerase
MDSTDDSIRLLYPGAERATHEARISPFGASLRSYRIRETDGAFRDVVWGYGDATQKQGGQGDVLFPFPGRIPNGTYRFEGHEQRLPCNDKEGRAAIHGFVRTRRWEPIVQAPSASAKPPAEITLRLAIEPDEHEGYPFRLIVVLTYALGPMVTFDPDGPVGLSCRFSISNVGTGPAPAGIGFHPYVSFGGEVDALSLALPARRALEFGPGFTPTGRVLDIAGGELDFASARPIGALRLNHCFEVLQPEAGERDIVTCRVSDGMRETVVWWEASIFRYVVAYTGDALPKGVARRAIAIEPMTCATDAFNHPEWGLRVIEPAGVFSGTFGILASPRPLRAS